MNQFIGALLERTKVHLSAQASYLLAQLALEDSSGVLYGWIRPALAAHRLDAAAATLDILVASKARESAHPPTHPPTHPPPGPHPTPHPTPHPPPAPRPAPHP